MVIRTLLLCFATAFLLAGQSASAQNATPPKKSGSATAKPKPVTKLAEKKPVAPVPLGRIVFPADPSVADAKRDFGAHGDGKTDDTAALQRAIDDTCGVGGKPARVLYLPNGVYRLTKTLVVHNALGPWLYGETRSGVVLKLDDGVQGVTSVLRTHPSDGGPTSADWFMRNLRNFTVDVGNNPETDGIRWCATNSGIIQNVRIIGNGKIGINTGFIGQSSPNLIQDAYISGFETGIQSMWAWGQTLSRITISNCRKVGVYVSAHAVGIEALTVKSTPRALLVDYPNDWTWWSGVVALVNADFSGGDPTLAAIRNRGVLYARNVKSSGFRAAIEDGNGKAVAESPVYEYVSQPGKNLFENPAKGLNLNIKREPIPFYEPDVTKYVCANDYGATFGDNTDDTDAIQKAINAAAVKGATVVYLRGVKGGDPNWYTINGTVHVFGSVRLVTGFGFARIIAKKDVGGFVIDDDSAPTVTFRNIDSFGGSPCLIQNASLKSTLVVESCGVNVVGNGLGDIFVTDCPGQIHLWQPDQKVWARHLNPEGDSDTGLVTNNGAWLWVLGVKHEGKGVRFVTKNGGKTEILGLFNYGPGIAKDDRRPMFIVEDSAFSVAGLREIAFDVPTWNVKVRETLNGMTKELTSETEGGWIGWALFTSTY